MSIFNFTLVAKLHTEEEAKDVFSQGKFEIEM